MKLQGKMVLWPANLDSSKNRSQGRRIPKPAAVQSPRLEEMAEAAKRLSLEVETVPGKSRPNVWWERTGYIVVPNKETKAVVLRQVASEIRKIRAAKVSQEKERK